MDQWLNDLRTVDSQRMPTRKCCGGHGYTGYDHRGRPIPCPVCEGRWDYGKSDIPPTLNGRCG